MSDEEQRVSERPPDSPPDAEMTWQRNSAQAHLAGQALLDALDRRSTRLGRHARRKTARILKLMD